MFSRGGNTLTVDKRMLFIRNMEDLEKEGIAFTEIEYEVITDANVIGELQYGPYFFRVWELTPKNPGEERKLFLRIREVSNRDIDYDNAKRDGYYHGGDIADELVILSSLFLRRRIKRGHVLRIGDTPVFYDKKGTHIIDTQLIDGQNNLVELASWFDLIKTLDESSHLKFILASKFYNKAIEIIEEQPDMAYLNLVSAIEVLCQDTDIGDTRIADFDQHLFNLINTIENAELQNKIEEAIVGRERFIGRRFVQFILNHVDESFWNYDLRPQLGRVEVGELPRLLKKIYKQRSDTLHSGEPFPPSVFTSPLHGCEIDFSLATMVREKRWEAKDYIPNPYFFERLVNHVLKNYLIRMTETT